MRAAAAFLLAADMPRRFLPGASGITPSGFFGGLPRLFDPCRASMARSSFSRSAIRRAMMCSVGISQESITRSQGPRRFVMAGQWKETWYPGDDGPGFVQVPPGNRRRDGSVPDQLQLANVVRVAKRVDALIDLLSATADALAATWDLKAEGISVQLDPEAGEDFEPTIQ